MEESGGVGLILPAEAPKGRSIYILFEPKTSCLSLSVWLIGKAVDSSMSMFWTFAKACLF